MSRFPPCELKLPTQVTPAPVLAMMVFLSMTAFAAPELTIPLLDAPEPAKSVELVSTRLEDPPPVKSYQPGTWGPNAIHQLIAPNAWRLPFERAWREKK